MALNVNSCVDSIYAKETISPIKIPRTLELSNLTTSLSGQVTNLATTLLPLPSTSPVEPTVIELETHHFRNEARAERVFRMLNDNGGLDFMLCPLGAPLGGFLDNEYVSMLSAHGGYWDRKDFARVILVETGRDPEKPVEWLKVQKNQSL